MPSLSRKKPLILIVFVGVSFGVVSWFAPTARTAAPAGRYIVACGVVNDTATGLAWQRAVDDTERTFEEAQQYCADLTLDNLTDWRCPSMRELVTLMDVVETKAVDEQVFATDTAFGYWSSTPYAGTDVDVAWSALKEGTQPERLATTTALSVRCVR